MPTDRPCDYADHNPDEPCWGRLGARDADYLMPSGKPVILWACEGHAKMWAWGVYVPQKEPDDD